MTPPDGTGDKPLPPAVRRLIQQTLPPEALAMLAGPVGEAVAQAAGYAGRVLSENTHSAYDSDWCACSAWCAAVDHHDVVLDLLIQGRRDASIAKRFF